MERSRSGNGGHLWVFFSEKVEAQLARQLGIKILETAIARDGKVKFQSFDRMFPNQDRMPQGGFGNLIALPLQRMAVEKQNGVFIDDNFEMNPSQTRILQEIRRFTGAEVMECLKQEHLPCCLSLTGMSEKIVMCFITVWPVVRRLKVKLMRRTGRCRRNR